MKKKSKVKSIEEYLKDLRDDSPETDFDYIQQQISLNLIELNKAYQEKYGVKKLVTRNYWRRYAKPYKESDIEILGWLNFSEFKKDVLGEIEDNKFNRDSIEVNIDDSLHSKGKWYFITSFSAGDTINWEFKKAIDTFCKAKKAKLVILPMRGCISSDEEYVLEDYEKIQPHIATSYILNSNLKVMELKLHPQQFLPLTGIERLSRESSLIVAHPKYEFKTTGVESSKYPHILHTTGSIGNGITYRNIRTGMISKEDHCLGGLIIQVIDDEKFHIRQAQFDIKTQSVTDLGNQYCSDGKVLKNYPKAIYIGDYHTDCTDKQAREATARMINKMKIPVALSGDVFSGRSISHYEKNNMQAILSRPENVSTLEKELNLMGEELSFLLNKCKHLKFKVIKGNHDEWLDNYLKFGTYIDDTPNHLLALHLAIYLLSGKNPAEEYLKKKFPKIANRLEFFKSSTSYKVADIELGQHGHQTQEGLRAGVSGIENSYVKGVFGHIHKPTIKRGTWFVGTLGQRIGHYMSGYGSSHLHTNCLVYENGTRQLVNIIDGHYDD